ncbi:hypothetical protein COOONC_04693 [Cooperia oncophora]
MEVFLQGKMGKGRNKNKEKDSYSGPSRRRRGGEDSESEESVASHMTVDDDMKSVQGDDMEDIDAPSFLDSLAEHVENASHKNISIRMAALRHIQLALCAQYVPDFVAKWRLTLIELITKNLKKTDEEIGVSAVLLALISLQLGEQMSSDVEEPLAILRTLVTDPARPEGLRALCALSIAITSHVASVSDESISASIKALRSTWAGIKVTAQGTRLFTTALPSWTLLLQNTDASTLNSAFGEFAKLAAFLEADQLDIRIATGEALAFLYELGAETRPGFRLPNHQQIVELLHALCSDGSKGRAKKDKRAQRFTFRQVYSSIVDKDTPSITVKFNRESLVLDSCASKLLYDLCCELLHGGMVRQLQHNELLRELFDLGPVQDVTQHEKINKFAKMAAHDAASKYRNQIRGKQRDKRNVVF